jgi:choline dehydrogenase-like flavoprotein
MYGHPHPGPQTPTVQGVMEARFFLSEDEWDAKRQSGDYDLVIVGSGFCGYAVAKRALDNDPHCRILVIERGPFFLADHFQNLCRPLTEVLGVPSETFPWTVSPATAEGQTGPVTWAHGMIPFFGGRSTHWSGWCPRPLPRELHGWPPTTVDAIQAYLDDAEQLLGVQRADEITVADDAGDALVYGVLQRLLTERCRGALKLNPDLSRAEAARIATAPFRTEGRSFAKHSVPVPLLGLVVDARKRAERGVGATLDIVTQCVVQQLHEQRGGIKSLSTSRGSCDLGGAKLVLAMGSLPPATLIHASSLELPWQDGRCSAHFLTSVVARIPLDGLGSSQPVEGLQMGACQVFGAREADYSRQFHVQLTAVTGGDGQEARVQRLLPDVKASPSQQQRTTSPNHVVLVLTGLGELDCDNPRTWFRRNSADPDPTTCSELQIDISDTDRSTWDAMDRAVFDVVAAIAGGAEVEFWHGDPEHGEWSNLVPSADARRVPCVVHESSTLHLGSEESAPVALDYRVRGLDNVYVTGGALWPRGGATGPTLTMVALAIHLADALALRASRSVSHLRLTERSDTKPPMAKAAGAR